MAFQSVTPNKIQPLALLTTIATAYTVPAITRTILSELDIANTTAVALQVTINLVPSGGTPSAANSLMEGVTIPANSTTQWRGRLVLLAGDTVQAFGSAVGLTLMGSVGEAV